MPTQSAIDVFVARREDFVIETEIVTALYAAVEERFATCDDPAHNWEHVQRVYRLALTIAEREGADRLTVAIAALLHDIGRLSTDGAGLDHAERSVLVAGELLERYGVPREKHEAILHAIRAHSFKKGMAPRTLEAAVVRDADWLDALGAVGIMRWAISMGKRNGIRNYHPEDPFAERRSPDERQYMLDRFFTKLLKLNEAMLTPSGQALAAERTAFLESYLSALRKELTA